MKMANLNLLAILIGCALPCLPGCESTASTSQPPARSATLDDPPSFGFDATKMGKSFNGGPVPVGTTPLLLKYSEGFYRPASPNTIPHFKEFHAYFQRVISSVQQNWDKILVVNADYNSPSLQIIFTHELREGAATPRPGDGGLEEGAAPRI
jgi:hypothetical protein